MTERREILMQLAGATVRLELELSGVVALNRYAVEARYPGEWEPITRTEAEEAVSTAREVRDAVRTHLPVEEDE